jgi:hypothetical protein
VAGVTDAGVTDAGVTDAGVAGAAGAAGVAGADFANAAGPPTRLVTQIPRVDAADITDMWRQHILPQRPVVITNVFAGQPLAGVTTLSAACDVLGAMPVVVRDEYSRRLRALGGEGAPGPSEETDLGSYLRAYGHRTASGRVVPELETPVPLLSLFSLPSFCRPRCAVHDIASQLFVSGAGNATHVHFDRDQRHVLLMQVFGRKRVVLFPLAATPKLLPVSNFGAIALDSMTDRERELFYAFAGAVEAVLEPTECLYIPPLTWHYIEYVDAGMSFNIRFGRNAYNKFMSVDNFLPDHYLQAVASRFASVPPEADLPQDLAAILDEIMTAVNRTYASPVDRNRAIRSVFREVYERWPDRPRPMFMFGVDDITDHFAERRMSVATPQGRTTIDHGDGRPAPATHLRDLARRLRELDYPDDLLAKIVENMFGRDDLAELTRSDVARMLAFVSTRSGRPIRAGAAP